MADAEGWNEFRRRFADHLDRFGHAIYDLDFAKSLAADEPAPLLDALKYFLTGQARNPHTSDRRRRRPSGAGHAGAAGTIERACAGGGSRRLLQAAQRYAPLREDALADVGLGWPLLRRMFREVGRRLVAAGTIAESRRGVLVEVGRGGDGSGRPRRELHPCPITVVRWPSARATWERERMVTPPVVLPIKGGALLRDMTSIVDAGTHRSGGGRHH